MVGKHKIILIAAVDRNWAIGKDNNLLYNVPSDMRFFRQQTLNNIVVYGRKTLESFPGGNPLPKRDNIVLSSNLPQTDGLYIASNISDVLSHVESLHDERPVFICGGARVYAQFTDIADEAYITKIDAETPGADAYFPNLDEMPNWEKRATFLTATDTDAGLNLCFERYCRKNYHM